jgi:hypothetical protein
MLQLDHNTAEHHTNWQSKIKTNLVDTTVLITALQRFFLIAPVVKVPPFEHCLNFSSSNSVTYTSA